MVWALAAIVSCLGALAQAGPISPLRVQLRWLHQAQIAGYYVAEVRASHEHAEHGIELIEGGPGIDPLDRLVKGEADVAIRWLADALSARARGTDIVNVAQIFRRPGMALACNKAAGVKGAADLAGRAVGVWNIRRAAGRGWAHRIWQEAGLDSGDSFTEATRRYLASAMGREPRTFLGEPYEEIAVFGSLLLYACLQVANRYEHSPWIVTASIVLTFCAVYAARMAVILLGVRSYRLGDALRRRRTGETGEQ